MFFYTGGRVEFPGFGPAPGVSFLAFFLGGRFAELPENQREKKMSSNPFYVLCMRQYLFFFFFFLTF